MTSQGGHRTSSKRNVLCLQYRLLCRSGPPIGRDVFGSPGRTTVERPYCRVVRTQLFGTCQTCSTLTDCKRRPRRPYLPGRPFLGKRHSMDSADRGLNLVVQGRDIERTKGNFFFFRSRLLPSLINDSNRSETYREPVTSHVFVPLLRPRYQTFTNVSFLSFLVNKTVIYYVL